MSRAADQQREAEAFARRFGVNLFPGSDDDGWERTPPVELPDGSRLFLHKDGEALAAATDAIRAAETRVLVETYILANDQTGRAFCRLLAETARRGVDVRLIYDSLGSVFTDRSWMNEIVEAGGQVREFHPIRPWECRRSWRPWHRDHRKLLIVDDNNGQPVAGVGGLNVGTRYAGPWVTRLARFDPATLWRDAGLGITGPAVAQFARCFATTWRYLDPRNADHVRTTVFASNLKPIGREKGHRIGRPGRLDADEMRPRGHPADVLADGADLGLLASAPSTSSPLRPVLYRLFRDARRSIHITMAYFAPDETMIRLLKEAAGRGVEVRLMLPHKSDSKVLVVAARSFYEELMDAGVRVYEREGVLLHAKHVVIDGELTVIGSTNLDFRSIETNLESSAVVRSAALGEQMLDLFAHDVAHSRAIDPDSWRQRPYVDRLVQWAVKRARYIL